MTSNLLISIISVEYEIMENLENIEVLNSGFQWLDIRSFAELAEYLVEKNEVKLDKIGNFAIGSNRFISFVGISNLIVGETSD